MQTHRFDLLSLVKSRVPTGRALGLGESDCRPCLCCDSSLPSALSGHYMSKISKAVSDAQDHTQELHCKGRIPEKRTKGKQNGLNLFGEHQNHGSPAETRARSQLGATQELGLLGPLGNRPLLGARALPSAVAWCSVQGLETDLYRKTAQSTRQAARAEWLPAGQKADTRSLS